MRRVDAIRGYGSCRTRNASPTSLSKKTWVVGILARYGPETVHAFLLDELRIPFDTRGERLSEIHPRGSEPRRMARRSERAIFTCRM